MAGKDDLVKELDLLGAKLGRKLDTTGTMAVLDLRIREAKEELDALSEGNDGELGENTAVSPGDSDIATGDTSTGSPLPARVNVRALRTLHLVGWDPATGRKVRQVNQGNHVLVDAEELPLLAGLVSEI